MYYTKFIVTPFHNTDVNTFIADILMNVIDQVRNDKDNVVMVDAILSMVQCIDHFIVLDNDQDIIKLCNQVGSFVMKVADSYQDILECICLHKEITYHITPLTSGVLIVFNEYR